GASAYTPAQSNEKQLLNRQRLKPQHGVRSVLQVKGQQVDTRTD
ncbi:uncharacterized, partial [Tachysurus ichikawai]